MNTVNVLNDPLNLRDYIVTLTNYVRDKGDSTSQPKTILSYLNILFHGLPLDNKENIVSVMQKVFSGNVSYTKVAPITNDVISGKWDQQLLNNLEIISACVFTLTNTDAFFRQLLQQVSLRFFSEQEYTQLHLLLDEGQYAMFLLVLTKHGFSSMYNIPCFFADRIYWEAQTYDYDNPKRFGLLHEAAKSGNKQACLEYGNYLTKKGSATEAFRFLMASLPNEAGIWNLAFMIENEMVGLEQIQQFKVTLNIDQKIASSKFDHCRHEVDAIICSERNSFSRSALMCAYRAYFYLAYSGFYKGFNSLYKLLDGKKLYVDEHNTAITTQALKDRYIRLAISGCETTAMTNMSSKMVEDFKKTTKDNAFTEKKEAFMQELISICADVGIYRAHYNWGDYQAHLLSTRPKDAISRSAIEKAYDKAEELDSDGHGIHGWLYDRIARITTDTDKKKLYFSKALKANRFHVAYDLSQLCYLEYSKTGKKHLLFEAKQILDDNIGFMTGVIQENASKLLKEINEQI